MSWADLTDKIKAYAPILGAAISVVNPAAGIATNLIASAFGADKTNPSDILSKIIADPEAALKLQKVQFDHIEALQQVNYENYKTEVDDRKDARDREKSLHDWVPTILAIGFLINYAAIQFYCVSNGTTENDIISARFQDVLIMIMSYYFGSMHKKPN